MAFSGSEDGTKLYLRQLSWQLRHRDFFFTGSGIMFYLSLFFSFLLLIRPSLRFFVFFSAFWGRGALSGGGGAGTAALARSDGALCVVFSGTGHGGAFCSASRLHRSLEVDVGGFVLFPPPFLSYLPAIILLDQQGAHDLRKPTSSWVRDTWRGGRIRCGT